LLHNIVLQAKTESSVRKMTKQVMVVQLRETLELLTDGA